MTTTEIDESQAAPPVAAPKKNVFQRIAGVLFAPAESFEEIVRRPDILAPLLLFIAIGYAGTVITAPRLDYESLLQQQEQAIRKQNPNMDEATRAQIEKITRATTKAGLWVGPILMTIWYFVVAGILFLAFRLMGGEGTFSQAVSATLYAWVPLILYGIVLAIVVLAQGSFDPLTAATAVKSNPAFLVEMKEQPVLFSFLASIDLFTIWTIVLLIFGFSALSKFSRAKSAAIVITLWAVQICVRLGFAALGAARMKG